MESFIRAALSKSNEPGTSRGIQQKVSKSTFRSTFFNGKELEVEYRYDRKRFGNECIKIKIRDLLPVFGNIKLPDKKIFVDLPDVENVLKTIPSLHQCEDGIYTPCSNLDSDLQVEEDTCPFDHFHHYCPEHVKAWFKWYLPKVIALQENDFTALMFTPDVTYANRELTEDRITNEFWLRLAQEHGCGCSRKISQKPLGQLSTNIFSATFLNGKEIDIEYNYDGTRPREERVKINIQGLLPVLGGTMPPDGRQFVSVLDVEDVLKSRLGLHQCEDGIYTPCSNLDADFQVEEDTCPFGHFHHYCPEHVNVWLKWYLPKVIALREGDFADLVKLEDSQYTDRMMTGDRLTPEFWLSFAQQHGCGCSRKISPKPLGQLSTNIFSATFLNGKEIEIEYNYDRTRPREERVKINIQGLLPVLGGTMPPDGQQFMSVLDVEDVLKSSLGLHQCEDGIYTPCSNLDADLQAEEDTCPFDHFHHYCPEHVNAWLKWYLPKVIALREGDFVDLVKLEDSQYTDRMMTGDRLTPEFWLHFAQQQGCGCSRKISPKPLVQLSTNIFSATFFNGKEIRVEYIYDRTRPCKERVQINLQGLLPVVGGTMTSDGRKFLSTYAVKAFLKANLNFHECSNGIFTPCTNLDSDLEEEEDHCPYDHFHHYCPEHVYAWFKYYLTTVIMLQEGDFAELVERTDPQYADYLMTGNRLTPKYWLRFAERRECGLCRDNSRGLPRQLFKHKIQATFLNGKEIVVTYTYDREVIFCDGCYIKVNIQDLLPVLGLTMPRDERKFVTILEVIDVLKTIPALHECEDGIFTPCSNLDADLQVEEDICPSNHFHHYCPEHVSSWLLQYLEVAIVMQQGDYSELLELAANEADYPTTGDQSTPEYWLHVARLRGCGLFRRQP